MSAANVQVEPLDDRIAVANRTLIGSQHVQPNPVEAISLYKRALAGGCGAAGERLAVMTAVGVVRPPDWNEALDLLAEGAALGHRPARGQLAVLAGRSGVDVESNAPGLWKTLRREIDLPGLLKPPAPRRVHVSPVIALIDGLVTPDMCAWIISRGAGRLSRGVVGDYKTGQWTSDPIRTGLAAGFGLTDIDLVMVMTQERLARASGFRVQQQEAPHVLSYEPGQEYKAHFDFLIPTEPAFRHLIDLMGQRVATCLIWLNDDYEGGETAFPKIGWKHRGKVGDAMLFLNVMQPGARPDGMSLHAGLPPTQGRKYLLSQWIRDKLQPIM